MPRRSSIHDKKIAPMPAHINSHSQPVPMNTRPSFLQTMKEGISFGVGSSIGHRIVSAAFGEPTPRVSAAFGEPTPRVSAAFGEPTLRVATSQTEKPLPKPTGSSEKHQEYEQCMKKYDDIAVCKRILEAKN